MKKVLIIIPLIILFNACKKDSAQSPKKTNSWISGKWKRETFIDTIFNGSVVAGVNNFNVSINPAEINFTSDNSGTSTISAYGTFNYSLSTNILTYGNGAVWKIVKISDTRLKLIMHESAGIGWNDGYVKE